MSDSHDARWVLQQAIAGWEAEVQTLEDEMAARETQRTTLDEADEQATDRIKDLREQIASSNRVLEGMERVGPGYLPPPPPRRQRTGGSRPRNLVSQLHDALRDLDQGQGVSADQVRLWAEQKGVNHRSLQSTLSKESRSAGGTVMRHPETKLWMRRP